MMAELTSAVWQNEPGWLQKKRQLAGMLQERFPKQDQQDEWLKAWREPVIPGQARGWLTHDGDYVAQPLAQAVNNYSQMLQENLAEKALSWQEGQLNAAHLSRIDGGQFIYVPDETTVEGPIKLAPVLSLQNPHTLIIVGAGAQVTIEETARIECSQPAFAAVEILMGTGARVHYRQFNRFDCPRALQVLHAYQAQGSRLRVEYGQASATSVTTSLYSFLDGAHAAWDAQAAIQVPYGSQQEIRPVLDGYGQGTRGQFTLWGQAEGDNLILHELRTGSGEPLQLDDSQVRLAPEERLADRLPAASWLKNKF
jgi:Fe-S cluster assembly protein SufD